jgi:transposase-like protein
LLVTSDGCAGMLKAIAEVYPEAARQRCLFHLRSTLMGAAPTALAPELRDRLEQVLGARDYAAAVKAGKQLVADYRGRAQAFVDKVEQHLPAMLVHFKFPQSHWKHIRTSNSIERLFEEVKRRTKVLPGFGSEQACLMVCHAVIIVDLASKKPWRRMQITSADLKHLEAIRTHLARYGKDIKDFIYMEAA